MREEGWRKDRKEDRRYLGGRHQKKEMKDGNMKKH